MLHLHFEGVYTAPSVYIRLDGDYLCGDNLLLIFLKNFIVTTHHYPINNERIKHRMNAAFWRNKKVLLTGHTGFKGSWLALWLQKLHADVIGFSLSPPTIPNLFSIAKVQKDMIPITGDIRDFLLLKNVIMEYQPEIIIHMAAQSLVRYSYQHPIDTYSTNVMGTVNLLQAAREVGTVKSLVNVTSDKCYENKESLHSYQEQDTLGGYDPYSNSKACAELVTSAFRQSYYNNADSLVRCGLASVRAGNVIGGGDWAQDRLIPDIIRAMIKSDPILIRHPQALRPWQHVLEPLQGYLQLAELLYTNPTDYSEAWNFGPDDEDVKPVSWIVETIQHLWNTSVCSQLDQAPQPHEASLLKLDSTKAKKKLGWKPRWNLEKTLEETVNWYRSYNAGHDMREITFAQINEYMITE